jgi:hypothetical protein
MDKQKRYVLSLLGMIILVTISLSALQEKRLEVYFGLFTISYFSVSAIYHPRRRGHDLVGLLLILTFLGIVFFNVMEIFSKLKF